MGTFAWLLTGGFLAGYRTQVLGVVTALTAIASYAVGDMSFVDLVTHIPIFAAGLGLATLGAKVNAAAPPNSPLAMRLRS